MPGDPASRDPGDDPVPSGTAADEARDHLVAALRAARAAALQASADPAAVTADLEERLRRVHRMLAATEDEPLAGDE